MEWARSKYGTVSTFTEVEGPNRISILLQGNSDAPSECVLNAPNTAPSPLGCDTMLPRMFLTFMKIKAHLYLGTY